MYCMRVLMMTNVSTRLARASATGEANWCKACICACGTQEEGRVRRQGA